MKFTKVVKASDYLYKYAKTNLRFDIYKREDDGKTRFYIYDNKYSKPYYGNSEYEIVPVYFDNYNDAKSLCYKFNKEEIKKFESNKKDIKQNFDLKIKELQKEKNTKLSQLDLLINTMNEELNNL